VADAIFEERRLAEIYDPLDPDRSDLDAYVALAGSLGARAKRGADRVRWIHGDVTMLPPLQVDLATMTANVAQVFLTDEEWASVLRCVRAALRPGGHLVFETRAPDKAAWRTWDREHSYRYVEIPGVGAVEAWEEVTDVSGELVTFQSMFRFRKDGAFLTSESTLRFRDRDGAARSLLTAGFTVDEVRDAPDRPGRELVFIAQRAD
jgi:SAM-dependent methyltransferase